ncbi:hypothetical protein K3495_g13687 [Podosphaera aphanis]|nr:hypothetical protein K3495_g13687 [Podosphaera aphanis]
MAPTAPSVSKKQSNMRARVPVSGNGKSTTMDKSQPYRTRTPSLLSKKDKHSKKHSAFLARIQKSQPEFPKRRRPNKKLITTMENLLDALPDFDKIKTDDIIQNSSKHYTLKSKPGAMKRKEILERKEKCRFEKNLALLTGSECAKPVPSSVNSQQLDQSMSPNFQSNSLATKFSALRAWANANIEKNPNFQQNL